MTVNVEYNIMWEKQTKLQALVDILNEQPGTDKQNVFSDGPEAVSIDEKRKLVDSLRQFSTMGTELYSQQNLKELTENLNTIVDIASRLVTEYGDVTDKVTAGRHMKLIQEALKVFKQDAACVQQFIKSRSPKEIGNIWKQVLLEKEDFYL